MGYGDVGYTPAQGMGALAGGFAQGVMRGIDRLQAQQDVSSALEAYRSVHPIYKSLPQDQWDVLKGSLSRTASGTMFGTDGGGDSQRVVSGIFGSMPQIQGQYEEQQMQREYLGQRIQQQNMQLEQERQQQAAREDAIPAIADQMQQQNEQQTPLLDRGLQAIGLASKPDPAQFGKLARAYAIGGVDPYRPVATQAMAGERNARANKPEGGDSPVAVAREARLTSEGEYRKERDASTAKLREEANKSREAISNARNAREQNEAINRHIQTIQRAMSEPPTQIEQATRENGQATYNARMSQTAAIYGIPIAPGQSWREATMAYLQSLRTQQPGQQAPAATQPGNQQSSSTTQPSGNAGAMSDDEIKRLLGL